MKRLFFTLILTLFVVFSIEAQQTSFTEISKGVNTGFIQFAYTADSAATVNSSQFTMGDFDGNVTSSTPATYYYNFTVAATGGATDSVALLLMVYGYFNGNAAVIDTLGGSAITVSSTTTSTSGTFDMNSKGAESYFIKSVGQAGGSAVTSGEIVLVYPKKEVY